MLENSQIAFFDMKIGDRSSRTFVRGERKRQVRFCISDGLSALMDILMVHINASIRAYNQNSRFKLIFNSPLVLVTGTKPPPQHEWEDLNEENFESLLERVWKSVRNNIKLSRTILPREEIEGFKDTQMKSFNFHFYAFLSKEEIDRTNLRVTQNNVEYHLERINQALTGDNPPEGFRVNGLATRHWAESFARGPRNAPLQPPTDNTTRNLQSLDESLQEIENEERSLLDNNVALDVEINGVVVPIIFKKDQLRKAVGLPDFPIVNVELFRNTQNEPLAYPRNPDREDIDHIDDLEEHE
jgi:hypothetical protein